MFKRILETNSFKTVVGLKNTKIRYVQKGWYLTQQVRGKNQPIPTLQKVSRYKVVKCILWMLLQCIKLSLRFQLVSKTGKKQDRKSTRLNSSHITISYAVFCLKKKNKLL